LSSILCQGARAFGSHTRLRLVFLTACKFLLCCVPEDVSALESEESEEEEDENIDEDK
jgi:hypothetical protein